MTNLKNTTPSPTRLHRLKHCLAAASRSPKGFLSHLKSSLLATLETETYTNSPIPAVSLSTLIDPSTKVALQNFVCQDGNASYLEVLALSACVAHLKPNTVLEIGTFDGNSTLQMALNLKKTGTIHTLDLPPGQTETAAPITEADLRYTNYVSTRKYANTSIEDRVIQHFGDSTAINFDDLNNGASFDFIFIDGGHSLECVKSDTEKSLKALSPKGVICWHDYNPICWPGVVEYLNSLSLELKLVRIEGTTIVYYQSS